MTRPSRACKILGGDPQAGFVEVLDRDRCADHVCDMGEEGLEAPGGSPAHGGDRGCGDGHCEEAAHEFGQALLGNELGVQQVAHPGGDAWPVLDRGGHGVREDGSCHGGAGAAEAAMGAVFGDLQGAWLGHIEDLSTDGRAVTVGVRQRCAAARTGGGVMIHNMVRALGPRQRRSLVARLAAAWRGGLAALASGAPLGSALLAQAVAGGRLCCWWCCQAPRSARARRCGPAGSRSPARARHSPGRAPWPGATAPGPIPGRP